MIKPSAKQKTKAVWLTLSVLVMLLLVWGISIIWGYLNSGADRAKMLHTEVISEAVYLPKVTWEPHTNEGRQMETYTLEDIQDDYLKAWYIKQVAYQWNTKRGIPDFYTDHAREKLYHFIEYNKDNNITLESTTLNHNPKLEFYSADGQTIVFTDNNVIEYQKVFKDKELVTIHEDTTAYRVLMLLEDGFWRIRHFEKIPKTHQLDTTPKTPFFYVENNKIKEDQNYFIVKGINYYPKESPWDTFGAKFDSITLNNDFQLISDKGLNTIRIFVQYEDFGKANVSTDKFEKLKKLIDIAKLHKLKVIVTLFDFYGDYSILDWTLTHRHAETLVTTFKDNPTILAWDIKNEPDLDFENRGKQNVLDWLSHTIDQVKAYDPNHLITIGWSSTKAALNLQDKVDFVSFHSYMSIDDFKSSYLNLKATTQKPLVLEEFGMSTYNGFWNWGGYNSKDQAEYYKVMQQFFQTEELSFMSWTLYDFTSVPKNVVGKLPWRKNKQKKFGLIDKDGNPKPAMEYISY